MITLTECATMCVLDHDDIQAIAEFEHIPEVAAATLDLYLANQRGDCPSAICKIMIGDIRAALDDGLVHQATEVMMALRRYLDDNPHAAPNISIH